MAFGLALSWARHFGGDDGASRISLPVRAVENNSYALPIATLNGRVQREAQANPHATDNYTLTQDGPDKNGLVVLHQVLKQPLQTLDTGAAIHRAERLVLVDSRGLSKQLSLEDAIDDRNQTGHVGHDDRRHRRAAIDTDTLPRQRVDPCPGRGQDHLREGVGQQGQARFDVTLPPLIIRLAGAVSYRIDIERRLRLTVIRYRLG